MRRWAAVSDRGYRTSPSGKKLGLYSAVNARGYNFEIRSGDLSNKNKTNSFSVGKRIYSYSSVSRPPSSPSTYSIVRIELSPEISALRGQVSSMSQFLQNLFFFGGKNGLSP